MTDSNFEQRARRIQWLFLDVDGVLTDGSLYFSENGDEMKGFSVLDGLGIKLLRRSGINVGILSGRNTQLVARRAKSLGLDTVIQGREDKWQALSEWRENHAREAPGSEPVPLDTIAFMGDDWPDLTVMTRVGLALTVANAHPAVAERAHWQSRRSGGHGAVREACDQLLTLRGDYERLLSEYIAPTPPDTDNPSGAKGA